jgi:hypothetical protein
MKDFYEFDYAEPGLTTQLPKFEELKALKQTSFIGSQKDFSYHISIFRALGLQPESYILDYGANWGYLTYQLTRAGYKADGYELSKSRASFGEKLGVQIFTELGQIQGNYDAVYSCHVLEHVENPIEVLRQQLTWTKKGGIVIAHTPNGSMDWRRANPGRFHLSWGRVHPVLLTDQLIRKNFQDISYYVSSIDSPDIVSQWNRNQSFTGNTSGAGLFFVLTNPN